MFFAREGIAFPADLEASLRAGLPPGNHGAVLGRLWEKLARGRGQVAEGDTHYSFMRPEAEAYAAYYLPANALKTALVLEEAYLLGLDAVENSSVWLDLGTGPGTAYWGTAWWCARRSRALQFHGWDQSQVFADLAGRLARESAFGGAPRFNTGRKDDPLSLIRTLSPTHVSLVNSIAEIYPDFETRLVAVTRMVSTLAKLSARDGRARYLLVIEPGSRESSRELAALKDRLQAEMPVKALLPCLDSRLCGALVNPRDWCHEEVECEFPEWVNEIGAAAGMRKESLLFSYCLLRVGAVPAVDGGLRIVSQRLERKGQVECWLCTPGGKRMVRAQRSKSGAESEPVLAGCRGDIWAGAEIGEKNDLVSASVVRPREGSVFSG